MQSTLEEQIEAKRFEIRSQMATLGDRIKSVDESELLVSIIPGQLACAHRPLRYHRVYGGSRKPLPAEALCAVNEWVELVNVEGIKSILSLMHDGDLGCYNELDLCAADLLGFLEHQDFIVARHPYEDPHHKRTPRREAEKTLLRVREEALKSYDKLPKPVLLMCSAGRDRSAPVGAFIFAKRANQLPR